MSKLALFVTYIIKSFHLLGVFTRICDNYWGEESSCSLKLHTFAWSNNYLFMLYHFILNSLQRGSLAVLFICSANTWSRQYHLSQMSLHHIHRMSFEVVDELKEKKAFGVKTSEFFSWQQRDLAGGSACFLSLVSTFHQTTPCSRTTTLLHLLHTFLLGRDSRFMILCLKYLQLLKHTSI